MSIPPSERIPPDPVRDEILMGDPVSAYPLPTRDELQAKAEAKVAAAVTATDLLALCLPGVAHDAATGIMGAPALKLKIEAFLILEGRLTP